MDDASVGSKAKPEKWERSNGEFHDYKKKLFQKKFMVVSHHVTTSKTFLRPLLERNIVNQKG